MHLDDLEHSQIILLSILLTLIISVATSVSVLSILESRHGDTTVVSKTINRIIERKISTDPSITKEAIEDDIESLITSISDGSLTCIIILCLCVLYCKIKVFSTF